MIPAVNISTSRAVTNTTATRRTSSNSDLHGLERKNQETNFQTNLLNLENKYIDDNNYKSFLEESNNALTKHDQEGLIEIFKKLPAEKAKLYVAQMHRSHFKNNLDNQHFIFMKAALSILPKKQSNFVFLEEPFGSTNPNRVILSPAGVRIIVENLMQRGKLDREIDCIVCDSYYAFKKSAQKTFSENKLENKTAHFLVRHEDPTVPEKYRVHFSAVFVKKSQEFGIEYFIADGNPAISQEQEQLHSSRKDFIFRIAKLINEIHPDSKSYTILDGRQSDRSNCPVFSLLDTVQMQKTNDIFSHARDNGFSTISNESLYPNVSIRALPLIPTGLMKTSQSFKKLSIYKNNIESSEEKEAFDKKIQKYLVEVDSRKLNSRVAKKFLDYENIILQSDDENKIVIQNTELPTIGNSKNKESTTSSEINRISNNGVNITAGELAGLVGRPPKLVLLMDYDGTLMENTDPYTSTASEGLKTTISKLTKHPDIEVFIVSGRDHPYHFKAIPENLGVHRIANHGADFLMDGESKWNTLIPKASLEWMSLVKNDMNEFAAKYSDVEVEVKSRGLTLHYEKCLYPQDIESKAESLCKNLRTRLKSSNLKIEHSAKVVEIRENNVDKGTASINVLNKFFGGKIPEGTVILAAGDADTDENMFDTLQNYPNAFTVRVGSGETGAHWRISDPSETRELLRRIADKF